MGIFICSGGGAGVGEAAGAAELSVFGAGSGVGCGAGDGEYSGDGEGEAAGMFMPGIFPAEPFCDAGCLGAGARTVFFGAVFFGAGFLPMSMPGIWSCLCCAPAVTHRAERMATVKML
ncbi:MAG TPA: hypothetical protein VF507_02005 [Pyrinomonadaceae bacterium]|jgi:hypothetical protein